MHPQFPSLAGEFLMQFNHDVRLRWSMDDLVAQQTFVADNISEGDWLDWSSPAAALELMQALLTDQFFPHPGEFGSLLVAGPVAEIIPPETLFSCAARQMPPGKHLVGVIPCMRDNSPESRLFIECAAKEFWAYFTAEELQEMLQEAGWQLSLEKSRYYQTPQFNIAVVQDSLNFKGFRSVFNSLEAEGYDPMEVGWGELRFVAVRGEEG